MARGRKKLPQAVLDLRGTARKDRNRSIEVVGQSIEEYNIACWNIPGYSELSQRARAIYAKCCRQLITLHLLEASYLPQLIVYAQQYDLYLDCVEDIQKNGRYITQRDLIGGIKSVIANPSVKQANQALEIIKSVGSNFGFTPVDRQKIRSVDQKTNAMNNIRSIIMEFDNEEGTDNQ